MKIYDAMLNIESSPAYAQAAKEKKEIKASVAKAHSLFSNRLTPCKLRMGMELVKKPTRSM